MKDRKHYLPLVLALVMCLSLAACGDRGAPGIIEDAPYDSAADPFGYDEYFGTWEGTGSAAGDTLEISAASGGMYFTLYSGDELAASGCAQNVPDYACIYFFNQHDGKAYQFASNGSGEMDLNTFGTFVMKMPAPRTSGEFEDIADVWYLDGEAAAESIIKIDANGEWTLYERPGGEGDPVMVDYGYLEREFGVEEQYYAHSRQFEDVAYDMHMALDKTAFWWGGEGDAYLCSANTQ